MAHQYMPKIFHDPHKNPLAPPPTYLMCGPLFHIMTSASQVLVFLLAMPLQCISKDNTASCFLNFFVFIMSPVVSEFTLHVVCLCFKLRHLTKQIPTLHNIINLVNVLSTIHWLFYTSASTFASTWRYRK